MDIPILCGRLRDGLISRHAGDSGFNRKSRSREGNNIQHPVWLQVCLQPSCFTKRYVSGHVPLHSRHVI